MPTYEPQGHLLGLWKKNGKVTILIDANGCPVVDWTIGNTAQFPPSGLSTAPAAAAPRSPYRHLELCGIAYTGTDYKNNRVCLYSEK